MQIEDRTNTTKQDILHRLQAQHAEIKQRLRKLEGHLSLTTAEQLEHARLKKLKLRAKDQIYALSQST